MKSRKAIREEVLVSLPEEIKIELNFLWLKKTSPSILKRLDHLLRNMAKNSKTSSFIQKCQEAGEEREALEKGKRAKAITWLKSKMQSLKDSNWSSHPVVAHKIYVAEEALEGRYINPFSGLIDHLWECVKEVAFAVASFGKEPSFNDWADYYTYPYTINCNLCESDLHLFQEGLINDAEKWRVSEEINLGFVSGNLSEKQGQLILVRGGLKSFTLPSFIQEAFFNRDLKELWQENDPDAYALYKQLLILSYYSFYKEGVIKPLVLPIPPSCSPKSIEQAEQLLDNANLAYFLSRFDSKDSKRHPRSLIQLKEMISLFLLLLGNYLQTGSIEKKQRKARDDARVRDANKAKKWMELQWHDQSISHTTMVDRFIVATLKDEIVLEGVYQRGAIERWACQADPWPVDIRRGREKSKNRKEFLD